MSEFKLDKKKIREAIADIQALKIKYAKIDTMFISLALDQSLKNIGRVYAGLLTGKE